MYQQKGFATIIIVLIIAVIAVGGYLMFRTPAPVVDNVLVSPTATVATPTATPVITAKPSVSPTTTPGATTTLNAVYFIEQETGVPYQKALKAYDNSVFYYVPFTVAATQKTLNAVLNEMINNKPIQFKCGDFNCYNELGKSLSRTNLHFASATIADGVAKVYLTGDLLPIGDIDTSDLQFRLALRQFPTIKKAWTYVNGTLYDWNNYNDMRGCDGPDDEYCSLTQEAAKKIALRWHLCEEWQLHCPAPNVTVSHNEDGSWRLVAVNGTRDDSGWMVDAIVGHVIDVSSNQNIWDVVSERMMRRVIY